MSRTSAGTGPPRGLRHHGELGKWSSTSRSGAGAPREATRFFQQLGGALAGLPAWTMLARKLEDNQGLPSAAAVALAAACVPMVFPLASGVTSPRCSSGHRVRGFWMMIAPAMGRRDRRHRRAHGPADDEVYLGFRAFFDTARYAVQRLRFAVCTPTASPRPPVREGRFRHPAAPGRDSRRAAARRVSSCSRPSTRSPRVCPAQPRAQ